MSKCQRRAARQRRADRLRDPPPVGVAAEQRRLDERRVGDRARDPLDRLLRRRRARARGRSAARPRRRRRSAARAGAAARRAPRRSARSSSLSGSTRDAAGPAGHQDHGVVGRELAVDADAVKRALDGSPEQRIGASARCSAASVCTKQSIVAKRGEIMPAPLHCADRRTLPDGSVTSSVGVLVERVGGPDRRARSRSPPSARSPCDERRQRRRRSARRAAGRRSRRSKATATSRGSRPSARRGRLLHARRLRHSGLAGRRVRVARVRHHRADAAQVAALARHQHRRRQHARVAEARRAHAPPASETTSPSRARRRVLDAAGHAGDAKAGRQRAGLGARAPGATRSARRRTRSPQPRPLVEAEHQVEVGDRLRGGPLPEVVDRGEHEAPCRCARRRAR